MPDPLVEKLQQYEQLSAEDRHALTALTERVRTYDKRTDILCEGDPLDGIYLLRKGWACRYTVLPGGRRQIVSFIIPGDLCNAHLMVFRRMEHRICALSSCEIGVIPPERFREVLDQHPRIGYALYLSSLVMESVLRERIVTLGRRTANQRIAHLFCELLLRLKAAGLAKNSSYDLPLTQIEIADTLGLNHVHVNRVIKTMHKMGLLKLKGHVLEILDWGGLTALGEFDSHHLNGFIKAGERTGTAQGRQS